MIDPRRLAAIAALSAALVAPWEGLWTVAKPDRLANNLPTVCYGMTPYDRPVTIGDKYTPEQCMAFLAQDIPRYRKGFEDCVHVDLTNHQWAALTSMALNAGSSAVCKSAAVRRFNAHDPDACDNIIGWRETAAGKYVPGLHNRRIAERNFCRTKD